MTTEHAFNLRGENAAPLDQHPGLRRAYRHDGMTLAVVTPLEAHREAMPTMADHAALARQAETAGFAQLWVRDVPLLDPDFDDAGQVFDTYTYLGFLAAITDSIALGSAASVLPLHHPIDIAKAAASVDQLSGGRFVLGVASGDRPIEFPAYGRDHDTRGQYFRDAVADVRRLLTERNPEFLSPFGRMTGQADLVPKPTHAGLPLFITGTCRQTVEWIAENADGWMYYMLPIQQQADTIETWRAATAPQGEPGWKPFHQSTFIDLDDDPLYAPTELPQGLRIGREPLLAVLDEWRKIGVDQVIFNFRHSRRPVAEVIEEFAEEILPSFPAGVLV